MMSTSGQRIFSPTRASSRCVQILLASAAVAVVLTACSSSTPRPSVPSAGEPVSEAAGPTPPPSGADSAASDASSGSVYAATGAGMLSARTVGQPYRLYVPESGGRTVTVIDPVAGKVIATYPTGLDPQHIVPAWDLTTLYATNDLANTVTPIDPKTGRPSGPAISVDDPYNMYFTPDGSSAIVVAEARQDLDFRDPHTFALKQRVHVDCAGVDHLDFSADGSFFVASCEFAAKLVKVDTSTFHIVGYLPLRNSSPQDVKLDAAGTTFYVADKFLRGVHLIDASSFHEVGFIPTGKDAHGLYPSRDGTQLYVSNCGAGTVSVIDFASRKVVAIWTIPGGGSPDMGGVSPDGKTLWLTGRYSHRVYGFDTASGKLTARITVGAEPHGMAVWPQPGRYSLGHTGNMR
jgi:YVTN family beta-propeller protein